MTQPGNPPLSFAGRIRALLKAVPRGCVATYGQIAQLAGNPSGTRAVVWIPSSSGTSHELPWHRIISARGVISTKGDTQARLLQEEGVAVKDNWVDLSVYRWQPPAALIDFIFSDG